MATKVDPTDPEIEDAIKDVRNEKTETSWAAFGYVPKTNRLKLLGTGTGRVAEMVAELSDAKLHFGYLRYEMSETWKYVFVAWCGEAVPATLKGTFTGHTADFASFLTQKNLQYSVQISARSEHDLEEAEIVKALNKTSTFIRARTAQDKPQQTIKEVSTQYWAQQSEKDAAHKEALQAHSKAKEQDMAASRAATEQKLRVKADEVLSQREASRQAEAEAFQKEQAERAAQQQQRLDGQRAQMQKNIEERHATAPQADTSTAAKTAAPAPAPRRVNPAPASAAPTKAAPAPPPSAAKPAPKAAPKAPPPPPQPEPEPEPEPEPVAEPEPQPEPEPEPEPQPEPVAEPEPEPEPQQGDSRPQAKALYEYQAAQEGDLAFNEGDIITIVDSSDPSGWWVGELNGLSGTFPSNFVQLI
jgi:hypothetical protein